MCGISGIISRGTPLPGLDQAIAAMVARQAHRGPDANGTFVDDERRVALGHNRLSIIDLSPTGAQPMTSRDGRYVVCYNGEIYNYQDLRAEIGAGPVYRGHSDTEVLLEAFRRWGADSFPRLNGMFAFAMLDRSQRRLFLVRDRLGIKPLFYARTDKGIVFSSEIKSIHASGLVERVPDLSCLHEFLYFGAPVGGNTFYQSVVQLAPSCFIEIDVDTGRIVREERYWSVSAVASMQTVSRADAVAETRHLLVKAVERQLASDVPVGAFLSGGIDSSAIVTLATRHYGRPLRTYTVGFDYIGDGEELPQARHVAALNGCEHHELHLSSRDIEELIVVLAEAHDQPFADPANIPLFQLSRAVGSETKVILQGDGGDELFGGYRRYPYLRLAGLWGVVGKAIDRGLRLAGGRYGKRIYGAHRFFQALAQDDAAKRMALLLSVEGPMQSPEAILSPNLRSEVARKDPFQRYRDVVASLSANDPLQAMLHADLQILLPDIFLEKVDRATMAASVEVRVPLLDFDLVDYVSALPSRLKVGPLTRKMLLREVLAGIVPEEILSARKKGFGVPIAAWLAGPLRAFAEARIRQFSGPNDWFDEDQVTRLFAEHASGRRDHAQLLWKALQLAIWRETLQVR